MTAVSAFGSPFCAQNLLGDDVDETNSQIVSLLLLTPNGIRDTLLEHFSPNQIARALVSVRAKREREVELKKKPEDYDEINLLDPEVANIVLFFRSSNNIGGYRENGIRGLHESWLSPGGATSNSANTSPHYREDAAGLMAGVNLYPITSMVTHRKPDKLLEFYSIQPKSAFLNIKSDLPGDKANYSSRSVLSYGYIGAVLSERVKQRSIWTSDDSLKMSGNPYAIERGLNGSLEIERAEFARHQADIDLHCGVFKTNSLLPKIGYEKFMHRKRWSDYREALVYGEILPSDIDHFIIEKTRVHAAALEELEAFGKPIYQMDFNGKSFKSGMLIYQP